MAVTDYDFQSTRAEIIERAFRIIGDLSLGDTLSAEQNAQGVQALNALVKSWQTEHIFLWTLVAKTVNLTVGDETYALSTDPPVIALDEAFLRVDGDDTRRLEIVSWREYQEIVDKDSPGDPELIALDHANGSLAYVWPVPSVSGRVLSYVGVVKSKDWDTPSSVGDFPVRFENALTYGLAASLAYEYGVPLSEKKDLNNMANKYLMLARQSDRERKDCEFVKSAY